MPTGIDGKQRSWYSRARTKQAKVAQLVEHSTENAGVVSSILSLGISLFLQRCETALELVLHLFLF